MAAPTVASPINPSTISKDGAAEIKFEDIKFMNVSASKLLNAVCSFSSFHP